MLAWLRSHAAELGRFGVVGIAGVVLNLAIFNWLRLGPLSEDSTFLGEQDRVITAKVIATVVSVDLRLGRSPLVDLPRPAHAPPGA